MRFRSRAAVLEGEGWRRSPIIMTIGASSSSSSSSSLLSWSFLRCPIRSLARMFDTLVRVREKIVFTTGDPEKDSIRNSKQINLTGELARSSVSCSAVEMALRVARRIKGDAESALAAEHAAASFSLPMEPLSSQIRSSCLSAEYWLETIEKLSRNRTRPRTAEKTAARTPSMDSKERTRRGSCMFCAIASRAQSGA